LPSTQQVHPTSSENLIQLQAAALEATAAAVVITDRSANVIWTNSAFERLTGYTRTEIVGQNTRVLNSGQNPKTLYQEMWQTILGGSIWRGELINRRKDGGLYHEEMTITPVCGSAKQVTHFVAVKQDITERKRIEQGTLFQNALLEAQAETGIDGILVVDESDRIVLANKQFALNFEIPADLIGTRDDLVVRKHVMDKVEDPDAFIERVKHLNSNREERSRDELRFKNGKRFDRYSAPLIDLKGRYRGRIWYFRDITDRIEAEERLRLWSRVLSQSAEGIFVCDVQERILMVNAAFEQVTGFSADEVLGKTPRILQSGRHDRTFYTDMWKSVMETGAWRGEMWNRRKDGELFVEWLSISAVYDDKGALTQYVGIFSDITTRKRAEEKIVHLAHHDALTDLPNRILLMDRLDQAIKAAPRRNQKVAAVFIDLDRFKEVNDSLGHEVGDLLLQTLAQRLSDSVRREDTVARIGGDEFVVIVQDLRDAQDVAAFAQKLLSCLERPVTLSGYQLTPTASIGISLYPDDATTAPDLIRNADAAMYRAKGAGRNTYQFYTSDMNQRALEILSMQNSLRRAIERQEFVLHYQPQINLSSGSVVGAEALIRWNHPDRGLIMPRDFISIAEESGLIVDIGNWVIAEASRQAAVWENSGKLSIPIAVNVSAAQFRRGDFVEQAERSVRKHGLTPNRIELELTESIIMHNVDATRAAIEKLHDMGFQLSIDDFGTGYSSLNYLRRFPIDKIKIDQSFVADVTRDENAVSIVTAVIGLARSLKLKVLAEGVETVEQLEILREQRCDAAQGFLYSRALVPEEFEKLVREWEPTFPAT
jgi:diguanylate cyclase (GGDEF)-like protein/PAS domain S-box-containing protein